MPFIFIMGSIFSCDQGFDENFDSEIAFAETFNSYNCSKMCDTSHFWIQASLAIFCLLIVIPLETLTRPHWQIIDLDLHFKSSPIGIILKAVFQVIIVASNLTLKESNRLIHSIIVCVSSVGLAFANYKLLWPWNYERLNWWFHIIYISYCGWNFVVLLAILLDNEKASTVLLLIFIVLDAVWIIFGLYRIKCLP